MMIWRVGAAALLAAPLVATTPAARADVDRKVAASPGGLLELDLDAGADVEISGWAENAVHVVARASHESLRVEVEETAKGVRVATGFDRASRQSSGIDLLIRVPERFDVEIESLGGGLRMENVEGTFEGETMGGELDLRKIRGTVRLQTMGGDITLRDSHVDGTLKTMGGEVTFEDVTGDVDGSSMGGNVVYRNVNRRDGSSTGRAVIISTMGGEINVEDAPDGANVSTMGGDIHVRSAAGTVKAKTMGGDIRIDAVDGAVKATTMGGDIQVVMVGDPRSGERDVDLRSYSGDIDLTVPVGLDMQIDIELAYTKDSGRDYRILSDFPVQQRETDEWDRSEGSPRRFLYGTATVGSGTHRVRIQTINGDVHLRRGN